MVKLSVFIFIQIKSIVLGHMDYMINESYAKAGEWAVSAQTKLGNNNRAGYKTKMPHDPNFNAKTWDELALYNMYKGIGWDKFQLDGSAHDCVIC